MRSCPECGESGIAEHSVLAVANEVRELGPTEAPSYSRCRSCDAIFARPDPETLTRLDDPPGEPLVRVVPPWKGSSDGNELQLSWDVVELFFEDHAGDAHLEPLRALIALLRERGFDSTLRAGQSSATLLLSRSREHGLREGQSHLSFTAEPDGRVKVEGLLEGAKHRFGPVPATFGGRIERAIESLAKLPLS